MADLERYIPFLRTLGLEVLAKVQGPDRVPIQQALDFGADAVVIPHVESAAHAKAVTAFAKFPPVGDRALPRPSTSYGSFDDDWVADQDRVTRCLPMIEAHTAIEEVEASLRSRPSMECSLVHRICRCAAAVGLTPALRTTSPTWHGG